MSHNDLKLFQAGPMAEQGIPKPASARISLADQFLQEIIHSHGCLTTVAHHFGTPTLVELMYLQGAVMKSTIIEHCVDDSKLLDCLAGLPSYTTWITYVDIVIDE